MFASANVLWSYSVEIGVLMIVVIDFGFFRNAATISEQIGQAVVRDHVSHFQRRDVQHCQRRVSVQRRAYVPGAFSVLGRVEEPAQCSREIDLKIVFCNVQNYLFRMLFDMM